MNIVFYYFVGIALILFFVAMEVTLSIIVAKRRYCFDTDRMAMAVKCRSSFYKKLQRTCKSVRVMIFLFTSGLVMYKLLAGSTQLKQITGVIFGWTVVLLLYYIVEHYSTKDVNDLIFRIETDRAREIAVERGYSETELEFRLSTTKQSIRDYEQVYLKLRFYR